MSCRTFAGTFLASCLLAIGSSQVDAQLAQSADGNTADGNTVELQVEGNAPAELTIGSKAPPLDIENWINGPTGKPTPLTEPFKAGNVYVVEFWATWCGPCVSSMPHIADLQKQYAKQKLTVISISDEDVPTIEKFLDQEVPADALGQADAKPITFRELTSPYRLSSDTDQSTQRDYMEGAGQNGIPTAFVVGKDGHIEWFGHPMELDAVVADVVADKWDRAAYKLKLEKEKQFEQLMKQVVMAVRQEKTADAIALLDKAMADESDPSRAAQIKQLKLRVLLAVRDTTAVPLAKEIIDGADDSSMLNGFAWTVYELNGREAVQQELMALALESGNKALKLATSADEKAGVRDTLAHLAASQGRVADAIKLQQAAVAEASPQLGRELQKYLEELQSMQAEGQSGEKTTPPSK